MSLINDLLMQLAPLINSRGINSQSINSHGINSLSTKNKHNINIIAVAGAADLGKTYLCGALVDTLRQQGISADYISLDSYLVARSDRVQQGLSGYQIQAYHTAAILNDLEHISQGKVISCVEYDHAAGRCLGEARLIKPCSWLFLEGVHAMNTMFKAFQTASVFLFTGDKQLLAIRHEANSSKRHQSAAFSRANSHMEYQQYRDNVAGYRDKADVQIELVRKWEYLIR